MLTVAAIQMHPHIGEKERNVNRSLELIDEASTKGAKLVVLPELCNSGYVFNSKEEAIALSELVPAGETAQKWIAKAQEKQLFIVAGINERDGDDLFNTSLFVGPSGYVGKYRKIHLWDREKLFFKPGNLGLSTFDVEFGKVGMMICYDGWHPETIRIHAVRNVDIVCNPTCWVVVPGVISEKNPLSPWIHASQANMNNLFVICADRIGEERGTTFLGHSCVASPSGFAAGPASFDKEEVLVADIDVEVARSKNWTDLANPISDRRTDLYDATLGYKT
jgi:N-carbamoylputrescine amidase